MLIAVGLGIGYFIFGGEPEPDPSAEVNQIIEGKETEKKEKEDSSEKKEGEEGEEGVIKKNVKEVPEVDTYETTYFEFPGDFTTNLKGSRKFLQVSVGVSTQYDEKVMEVVDSHQLALRSEILSTISDFTEEEISGSDGKKKLSERLMVVLNKKLEALNEFPGIEDVYFTAFILQ
jgi:flagellar FliL protein